MTIKLISVAPFEVELEFADDKHFAHRSSEYVIVTLRENGLTTAEKVATIQKLFPNKDVQHTFRYILSKNDDMSVRVLFLQPTAEPETFLTTAGPSEVGGTWTIFLNSIGNLAVRKTKANSSTPRLQMKEFPGDVDFLIKASMILHCASNPYHNSERAIKDAFIIAFNRFERHSF